ncbi:tol-pal system protein YbgF [Kordiimonas sediminis]|uniref:Tol-pal system protein YbgF n=1 Tax=Kordiimonas sediminis TaxID=1735581 RepID=A0A919E8F8_9PROT|nr:tetratricopeptide repeat protein [Kordiimonas sediminis]GHF23320.1 tol-pal system protein YbgF [Kordiimonas sediminis]
MRIYLVSLLVFLMAIPASAQSAKELDRKIIAIEKQLRAVQRRVFQGGQLPPEENVPQQATTADRGVLAQMSVKVDSLEAQLRALTGQIEELQYRQREQQNALDMLRREMSFRAGGSAAGTAQTTPQTYSPEPPAASGEFLAEPAAEPVAPAASVVSLPNGSVDEQYTYAFSFVRKEQLDNARIAFEQFIEKNKGDSRIGNARYWLGRVHMLQGRPGLAANEFLSLVTDFPDHERRPAALVDLGEVLISMDAPSEACNTLAEFGRVGSGESSRLKDRAKRLEKQAGCS